MLIRQASLFFDAGGHYIITVMRSDRAKYAVNSLTEGTAEENKATAQGAITYFGTYSVSEADRAIAIHIDGSSFPNWNGADQKRIVALTGDQLKLTAPIAVGTAEIVWKRAPINRLSRGPTASVAVQRESPTPSLQ